MHSISCHFMIRIILRSKTEKDPRKTILKPHLKKSVVSQNFKGDRGRKLLFLKTRNIK